MVNKILTIEYEDLFAVSEVDQVNSEYDEFGNHHEGNPLSLVIGAVIHGAGQYLHGIKGNTDIAYVDASQRAELIVTDGYGGISIIPVLTALEKSILPDECTIFLSKSGALALAQDENPATEEVLQELLKAGFTFSATPTAGSLASRESIANYAREQIGLDPLPHIIHRRALTQAQTIGKDGIGFW